MSETLSRAPFDEAASQQILKFLVGIKKLGGRHKSTERGLQVDNLPNIGCKDSRLLLLKLLAAQWVVFGAWCLPMLSATSSGAGQFKMKVATLTDAIR